MVSAVAPTLHVECVWSVWAGNRNVGGYQQISVSRSHEEKKTITPINTCRDVRITKTPKRDRNINISVIQHICSTALLVCIIFHTTLRLVNRQRYKQATLAFA